MKREKKTLKRKNKNKLEDRYTETDVAWEGRPDRKEKKKKRQREGGGEKKKHGES